MADNSWMDEFDDANERLQESFNIDGNTDDFENSVPTEVVPPSDVDTGSDKPLDFAHMVRLSYEQSEENFSKFPKTVLRSVNVKHAMDSPQIKFALLVLADLNSFGAYVKTAENYLSRHVEHVLQKVDEKCNFTTQELDTVINAIKICTGKPYYMKRLRTRVMEWRKKIKQRERLMQPDVDDALFSKTMSLIQKIPREREPVETIFKRTTAARFGWMKNGVPVKTILDTFNHYQRFGQIIIKNDFIFITQSKPKRCSDLGAFFRAEEQTFLKLAISKKLTTKAEIDASDNRDIFLLQLLPKIFCEYAPKAAKTKNNRQEPPQTPANKTRGKKKSPTQKALDQRPICLPVPDCVSLRVAKEVVLGMKVDYTFITSIKDNGASRFVVVIMDNMIVIDGDGYDALDIFFKSHYALDFEAAPQYAFLFDFLTALILPTSKVSTAVDKFMDDFERMREVMSL